MSGKTKRISLEDYLLKEEGMMLEDYYECNPDERRALDNAYNSYLKEINQDTVYDELHRQQMEDFAIDYNTEV